MQADEPETDQGCLIPMNCQLRLLRGMRPQILQGQQVLRQQRHYRLAHLTPGL